MSIKEKVIATVTAMPETLSFKEIVYQLHVLESVEQGIAEVERGEVYTDEEADAFLDQLDADAMNHA